MECELIYAFAKRPVAGRFERIGSLPPRILRLARERFSYDEALAGAVRGGLRIGVSSYSIKKVEALYGRKHTGDVADAGASIDAYEAYRASGDETALKRIEEYNRDDCDSTRELRDHLLGLRAAAVADGRLGARPIRHGAHLRARETTDRT